MYAMNYSDALLPSNHEINRLLLYYLREKIQEDTDREIEGTCRIDKII